MNFVGGRRRYSQEKESKNLHTNSHRGRQSHSRVWNYVKSDTTKWLNESNGKKNLKPVRCIKCGGHERWFIYPPKTNRLGLLFVISIVYVLSSTQQQQQQQYSMKRALLAWHTNNWKQHVCVRACYLIFSPFMPHSDVLFLLLLLFSENSTTLAKNQSFIVNAAIAFIVSLSDIPFAVRSYLVEQSHIFPFRLSQLILFHLYATRIHTASNNS